MAKVPPVTEEDFGLLPGLTAHARYLVLNHNARQVGAAMHTEDPALPGFTSEGLAAAQHGPGGVIPHGHSFAVVGKQIVEEQQSAVADINEWIGAPFHRTEILDPHLLRIALGRYCDREVCAAAWSGDLQQSWKASELEQFPNPVEFPSDGSTLPATLRSFGGEWPSPLSSCPGYALPTGEPISLQFDNRFVPKLTAFAVTRNGTPVETCGIDSTSYVNSEPAVQNTGRGCFWDSVVLIPRAPLDPGAKYSVTATVQGTRPVWNSPDGPWLKFVGQTRTYSWAFSVER